MLLAVGSCRLMERLVNELRHQGMSMQEVLSWTRPCIPLWTSGRGDLGLQLPFHSSQKGFCVRLARSPALVHKGTGQNYYVLPN